MPRKKQSCLIPFKDEIITLRETIPPTPYTEIAEILKEKHQISITGGAIHGFLRTLAKGYKPCKLVEQIRQREKAQITASMNQTPERKEPASMPPQAKELNVPVSHEHILNLRPKEERALRVAEIEAREAEEAERRKQLKRN